MASDDKKGGGGLDDLKARLGLDSVLSRARKEPPKPPAGSTPAAPSPPPGAPRDPGSSAATDPRAGFDAPAELEPIAEPEPAVDYSEAVSTLEEPVAGEGEPDPVLTDSHKLVDLNLAVPVSKSARLALVIVALVAVLGALGAGFGFGKVMRDREVADEVVATAGALAEQIETLGAGIGEFQVALAGFPNEYSPEIHALFVGTYEGTRGPILSSRTIADARIIMTTGEDFARDLINFALSTQILQVMVHEHLRKTLSDRRLIEGLLAAQDERPTNYAVVFSWDDASQRFNEFYESPDEVAFLPSRGLVATFDTLDMQVQNPESENPVFQYPVLIGGRQEMVAVYNVIVVDADQFVSNPNEETALTRYAARVAGIREYLENLVATQAILVQLLRNRAGLSSTIPE